VSLRALESGEDPRDGAGDADLSDMRRAGA
jgi:hypothetical protein